MCQCSQFPFPQASTAIWNQRFRGQRDMLNYLIQVPSAAMHSVTLAQTKRLHWNIPTSIFLYLGILPRKNVWSENKKDLFSKSKCKHCWTVKALETPTPTIPEKYRYLTYKSDHICFAIWVIQTHKYFRFNSFASHAVDESLLLWYLRSLTRGGPGNVLRLPSEFPPESLNFFFKCIHLFCFHTLKIYVISLDTFASWTTNNLTARKNVCFVDNSIFILRMLP